MSSVPMPVATAPTTTATAPILRPHSPWITIRFRRARELKRGWAMLGIPNRAYPAVAMRLFERQAKLVAKHDAEGFTSLLFEAPTALAAQLALTFPAPPGHDPLAIAATGDRILSGKAARSAKAIQQAIDPSELTNDPDSERDLPDSEHDLDVAEEN